MKGNIHILSLYDVILLIPNPPVLSRLTLHNFKSSILLYWYTTNAHGLNVRECVTLATIMQKDIFDHNFRTKALRMTILASRYMFSRSRNLMVPFVLTYDLELSRS